MNVLNPLPHHHAHWPIRQISHSATADGEQTPHWTTELIAMIDGQAPVTLLASLSNPELEWVATALRSVTGAPAEYDITNPRRV